MDHVDGGSRRQARHDVGHRTPGGSRRDGISSTEWVGAAIGLVLTAAVGVATVTITLVEAGDRTTGVPATATVDTRPATPAPWGLRLTPQGLLAPYDATPPTPLEELYAELLRPPSR